jgi:hypothetical protein
VRPPPSPWVETFVSLLAFIAPEWGLFASACVSAGGLCLAEGPFARLSPHQKFPFPAQLETGSPENDLTGPASASAFPNAFLCGRRQAFLSASPISKSPL